MRARLLLIGFYTLAPWILGGSRSRARQLVEECQQRDQAWGHEAQALYALGTGDAAGAVENFAKAHVLLPRERDPALFLAKAYLADQQPQAAIETLERLVDKYPRFQEAWLELGKIAADNNLQSIRGMAALEHYLANADDETGARRAEAATALARLYVNADRPTDAIGALRQARDEDPSNREARRLLDSICRSSPRACADDRAG
jgi:predicted Zn-dependent protease